MESINSFDATVNDHKSAAQNESKEVLRAFQIRDYISAYTAEFTKTDDLINIAEQKLHNGDSVRREIREIKTRLRVAKQLHSNRKKLCMFCPVMTLPDNVQREVKNMPSDTVVYIGSGFNSRMSGSAIRKSGSGEVITVAGKTFELQRFYGQTYGSEVSYAVNDILNVLRKNMRSIGMSVAFLPKFGPDLFRISIGGKVIKSLILAIQTCLGSSNSAERAIRTINTIMSNEITTIEDYDRFLESIGYSHNEDIKSFGKALGLPECDYKTVLAYEIPRRDDDSKMEPLKNSIRWAIKRLRMPFGMCCSDVVHLATFMFFPEEKSNVLEETLRALNELKVFIQSCANPTAMLALIYAVLVPQKLLLDAESDDNVVAAILGYCRKALMNYYVVAPYTAMLIPDYRLVAENNHLVFDETRESPDGYTPTRFDHLIEWYRNLGITIERWANSGNQSKILCEPCI